MEFADHVKCTMQIEELIFNATILLILAIQVRISGVQLYGSCEGNAVPVVSYPTNQYS